MNKTSALPRILPFALFMGFIGIGEAFHLMEKAGWLTFDGMTHYYLYPARTFAVLCALVWYWRDYSEITGADLKVARNTAASVGVGLLVFVIWINMDFPFATIGTLQGYDPTIVPDDGVRTGLIAIRLAGASLIVPIMEELFWRSFLTRYLLEKDYWKVPLGRFTVSSFIISSLLFGMEHNLFLAGIMAGVFYNLVLYYTKSISQCILSHSMTNLCLGVYVLMTGKYHFW